MVSIRLGNATALILILKLSDYALEELLVAVI
jgi:hypothetical protein